MVSVTRRRALAVLASIGSTPGLAMASVEPARVPKLSRGFNLPDLVPNTRSKPIRHQDLSVLKQLGMTHVRLPIHGEHVMPRFADTATVAAAYDDLDHAIEMLLDVGFVVTADMHPGPDFARLYGSDPEGALAALIDAWRGLAPRLRRFSTATVLAELLNEPPTSDDIWRRHAAVLVAMLRPMLPTTTFVTGAAPYQRVEALTAWPKLPDGNIIYAFHYYDPMAFTHQGASWMPDSPLARLTDVPFPTNRDDPRILKQLRGLRAAGDLEFADSIEASLATPWTAQRIGLQFAPLAAWSKAQGVPVILNEFGVLRFKASPADRAAWLSAVRQAAESHGFGWAHWDYDAGFGLMNPDGPDRTTIGALIGG